MGGSAFDAQIVPAEEWRRAVDSMADDVREHYVLSDVAERLGDSIEAWRPSTAAPLTRSAFVETLLADVREWSGDQHFLVFHPSLPPADLSPTPSTGRGRWCST